MPVGTEEGLRTVLRSQGLTEEKIIEAIEALGACGALTITDDYRLLLPR
jgi:hypothetical protein